MDKNINFRCLKNTKTKTNFNQNVFFLTKSEFKNPETIIENVIFKNSDYIRNETVFSSLLEFCAFITFLSIVISTGAL